jgi:hypothetical protein
MHCICTCRSTLEYVCHCCFPPCGACCLLLLLSCCTLRVRQGLQNAPGRAPAADRAAEQAFTSYYDTAELYYAYHLIYTTANQPFKIVDDATLFNAARSVGADPALRWCPWNELCRLVTAARRQQCAPLQGKLEPPQRWALYMCCCDRAPKLV